MAISAPHYHLLRTLFESNLLPQNGALLEIGQANWYGDVSPLTMVDDIRKFVTDPQRRDALIKRLTQIVEASEKAHQSPGFDPVKICYDLFFSPVEVQAVDFGGTETALKLDLNRPIALNRRFEVVINHGTAEHIFNIAQVFMTMHDYTVPGGLMIHESPFTGWIDHGFYNLQPTLFVDVALCNQYEICAMFIETLADKTILRIARREDVYQLADSKRIPDNAMLYTVLRKGPEERPFEVPMQSYYAHRLSPDGHAAWHKLR
jgi:hypothetical protein